MSNQTRLTVEQWAKMLEAHDVTGEDVKAHREAMFKTRGGSSAGTAARRAVESGRETF